jgi:hypothetical protein
MDNKIYTNFFRLLVYIYSELLVEPRDQAKFKPI